MQGRCPCKNMTLEGVKMKKAIFGLIVLLVLGFVVLGCDNGTNGNPEGVYSGYGVWLITQTNYDAYDGTKQPTPTAMGVISTLSATFSVDFYNVQNYNTSENPGWNISSSQTSWTAVSDNYYVLIVPRYFPSGIAEDGELWWMFDEGKISGSGSTPSKLNITTNNPTFTLTDFINVSAIE
jgi:hypothetical protein